MILGLETKAGANNLFAPADKTLFYKLLERFPAALACPDPDAVLNIVDEDLSVPDLACLCRALDRLERLAQQTVGLRARAITSGGAER